MWCILFLFVVYWPILLSYRSILLIISCLSLIKEFISFKKNVLQLKNRLHQNLYIIEKENPNSVRIYLGT